MRYKVYIETSVASYLTARPGRDLVVAAHQELTAEWWENHRLRFDLYISELVLRESSQGDPSAAARRMRELAGIPFLPLDESAQELARSLIRQRIIPEKAAEDALHVAIAASQGMDFLLTWNCRHIANAEIIKQLEAACLSLGLVLPVLCTPEQLLGQ